MVARLVFLCTNTKDGTFHNAPYMMTLNHRITISFCDSTQI